LTLGLEPIEGYSRRGAQAALPAGPLFGEAGESWMPRDGAIRRGEVVRDQAIATYRAQLPTQHPAMLRDDPTGRETVGKRKGR
jgi:hypothetical protein